jgi:hypothetical protein
MGLASAGKLSFHTGSVGSGTKRPRNSEDVASPAASSGTSSNSGGSTAAPTPTVSKDLFPRNGNMTEYALPMYGNDLGKLPVYGEINFSNSQESFGRPRRDSAPRYSNFSSLAYGDPQAVTGHSFGPPMHDISDGRNPNFGSSSLGLGSSDGRVPLQHQSSVDWDPRRNLGAGVVERSVTGSSGVGPVDSDTLTMWSNAPSSFE